MASFNLIKKYNVPVPRYTSYPTVPFWETEKWTKDAWIDSVKRSYNESRPSGISLYIHLPFCESLCTYCGCNTRITKNHTVEEPYIDAIIKEWLMYCEILGTKPRIREIHLGGGTPTFFQPENLKKLIQTIVSNAEIVGKADFSFEAHPANTTPEHLQTLFDCGFRRLSLGIQDFDPQVQLVINRHQSVEQVSRITAAAREIGYTSINFDLIYGLPLQTLNSVETTVDEVIKLMPDRIAYYSYAHVPWLKPGQRSFTEADLPKDDEKQALYNRGSEMLSKAGYRDIGMDHFALESDSLFKAEQEKYLHRNFMGYTHQYTQLSIGLGVSSISDSLYAFAQNAKTVEDYLKSIAQGEFSFIKGHLLTREDLVIRRHILNIMCKGETYLTFENWSGDIIPRLLPLMNDGLIDLEDGKLTVTATGKSFLRNICMCFDKRLFNQESQSQVFSMAV